MILFAMRLMVSLSQKMSATYDSLAVMIRPFLMSKGMEAKNKAQNVKRKTQNVTGNPRPLRSGAAMACHVSRSRFYLLRFTFCVSRPYLACGSGGCLAR